MAKTTSVSKAEQELTRLATEMGLELVDVVLTKETGAIYLRISIDKEGGLSLSDCEAFHKRCIPLVEGVQYDFLECSSPGIDRPLKTERDFIKHIGSTIEVKLYRPAEGKKAFSGTLLWYADGAFSVQTQQGARDFTLKEASQIRPVIDWESQFEQIELEGEDET